MAIGAKLKVIREETLKLRQMDVADRLEISRSYYGHLERDLGKRPDKDILDRMSELFGLTKNELYKAYGYKEVENISENKALYSAGKLNPFLMAATELADISKAMIPVFSEISADWFNAIDAIDWIATSRGKPVPGSWRAYRIKGVCLSDEISEGDTVIVDHALKDYRSGDLVACIKDGKSYIKRFVIKNNQPVLENNYGDLTPKDCLIQGIVVQVIKKYR